jgi:uncharacterized protein
MIFPNNETILQLHKKYAPSDSAFQIVYEHCRIIDEIATLLIDKSRLKLDTKLIHAAAMLHDIGYYPLFDTTDRVPKNLTITHGVTGAEILRKENINEAICRIAERHTGVGLTRENIFKQNLPLPPRDLVAETPEEQLIMYADKLHTKSLGPNDPHDTRGWFNLPETYSQHTRKFSEDNLAKFNRLVKSYGIPDLQALANKYNEKLI